MPEVLPSILATLTVPQHRSNTELTMLQRLHDLGHGSWTADVYQTESTRFTSAGKRSRERHIEINFRQNPLSNSMARRDDPSADLNSDLIRVQDNTCGRSVAHMWSGNL